MIFININKSFFIYIYKKDYFETTLNKKYKYYSYVF